MEDEFTFSRLIVDSIPGLVAVLAPDGDVRFCNRQILEYTGRTPEELRQWGTNDIIHPEDLPHVTRVFAQSIAAGMPYEIAQRLRQSDGFYRWFQHKGFPARDADGHIAHWCVLLTNIDDLKRAEEMLRERDHESRMVIDTIPGLVGVNLPSGEIEILNRQMLEYFGKPMEEMRNWGENDAIHPEDLPRATQAFSYAMASNEPLEYEARLRRFDGVYRWFQVRSLPTRDTTGRILRWYTLATDIDDRKSAEDALQAIGRSFKLIVDTIPMMAWTALPDGHCDFFSRRWLDYAGMTTDQAQGQGWADAIHPEERERLIESWQSALASGLPVEAEARMRRFDTTYRWFLFRASPLRDDSGKIVKWYGTNIDIDDRRHREQAPSASEVSWRQIVDNIPGLVATMGPMGEVEFLNRQTLEYFGKTNEDLRNWSLIGAVHPDDLPRAMEARAKSTESGQMYEVEYRCQRADGVYRWFQVRGLPARNEDGTKTVWYLLLTDIEDRKRGEEALQSNERNLSLVINTIPTHIYVLNTKGFVQQVNQAVMDYTGLTLEDVQQEDYRNRVIHPEDFKRVWAEREASVRRPAPFSTEQRVLGKDGQYRWFLVRYKPLLDEHGRIVRWYVVAFDIEDRKRMEDALRTSERELRQRESDLHEAQRLSHSRSWKLNITTGRVTVSPKIYQAFDAQPDQDISDPEFWFGRIHPEDRLRLRENLEKCIADKLYFEADYRTILSDGTIGYQHSVGRPLLGEAGTTVEFLGTTIDVTEQVQARIKLETAFEEIKQLKDRLYAENLVLRDEVDRTSMFEEIVGTSPTLQPVLKRIARVAPTDSTVLITGESGTGKELVARAIHRRSARAAMSFVSVNCAALPRELVASELFGHEKGAFTGATQRRLGRFELANGGTIFLDEVGELPMETQVALLRVLQEREFDRVGGSKSVHVDVRVIAATNRDLQTAIQGGAFRSDLFYRLNVFPITVPALRERTEDIPVLVEYFIDRYARKSGKSIRQLKKRTLDQLRSYPWPGNVRELQNVIERSVILCDTGEFKVDDSWISARPAIERPLALPGTVAAHEKAVIEDALRASGGRVFGPSGAAERLGIPRSTLDSKIRALKINKNHFRARPSKS